MLGLGEDTQSVRTPPLCDACYRSSGSEIFLLFEEYPP